jgi:hypothetical protein
MNLLNDDTFKRIFRVDRAVFDMLIASISPYFRNLNVTRARNSSGSPISITTRLAVTLQWLAGGSYLDLCFALVSVPPRFIMRTACCGRPWRCWIKPFQWVFLLAMK